MARFEEMRQASTEIDVESETETEKTMESKTKDNKKTPAGANAGQAALEMTASWEKKAFHPLLVGLGIKGIKHLKKKYDEDEEFRAKVDGAVGDFADLGKALVQRGTEALLGDDDDATSKAAAAMSAYIDVLSNDMLKHKSLPSSPETLCGKIVADIFRPSAIDEMCDICMTLGDNFVNEAKTAQAKPERDFSEEEAYGEPDDDEDYDPEFIDDDDDDVSWGLDEGDYELPDGDDAGTFINRDGDDDDEDEDEEGEASEGGYFGLDDDGASIEDSVMDFFRENPHELEEFLNYVTKRKGSKSAAAAKVALNYTLDGQKIVDGFKVMMTSQEAASMPYLDMNRVTISEKITCSDCKEPSWLQTVASCSDCNQFKCSTCMESMRDFSGICRRCANTIDGTIGDDSPVTERDMYFEYFLNSETEAPLFLPEGE